MNCWHRRSHIVNRAASSQRSTIYNPNEGRTLEVNGIPLTFKVTGEETGGAFALIEATVPPHFSGSAPHLHKQTTEVYYIVQGTLAFTLGDETLVLRQGSFVLVPPGIVHRYWNPAAVPATYLTWLSPAGFERYFEALAMMENEPLCLPSDVNHLTALGMQYDQYPAPAQIEDATL
jgi:mannose-6-phosphate isomerase-like protein (cupin superfamily)